MAVGYRACFWPKTHERWVCVLWNNSLPVLFIHAMRDSARVISFDMADGELLSPEDSQYLNMLCDGKHRDLYMAALARAKAAGIVDPFWERAA